MSTYGQYCPVARAAEIFAERWTPLIIRDLVHGMRHFNELERGLPGIPRSLLAQRLRRLEHVGVVDRRVAPNRRAVEYCLTPAGQQLEAVVEVLGNWGAQWALSEPRPEELDPALLLCWMKRRVVLHLLPPHRVVVQFDVRGACTGTYWLVTEPTEVSVCLQHPGFDVDLLVTADIAALYRVWLGRLTFAGALRDGLIELDGPMPFVRAFPGWLALSTFAPAVRAAGATEPVTIP